MENNDFDKILRMNTEAERRQIAAQVMCAMLSFDSYQNADTIAKNAVYYADALIAELNKKKDENN